MKTVIETPTFKKQANSIWSEDERLDFIEYLVTHEMEGDVIPGAGGVRKIRWSVDRAGKRGGVRVIYLIENEAGVIYLLVIYKKSEKGNITAKEINKERSK